MIKKILKKAGTCLFFLLAIYFIFQEDITNIIKTEEKIKIDVKNISKEDSFQIQFIDVGQAESILIENNNHYVLIDAGNNKDGKKLVKYFKELNIKKFDYIIGTHAHEDHIGGIDYIINNFACNHYYMPKTKVDNLTYQDIISALEKNNIPLETPKIDSSFQVENTTFEILSIRDDKEDLNNTSIVIKVKYFNNSFLLMSDATIDVETSILEKDIASDVLKVSHHGSNYGTTAKFLYLVHPKYAVIQVGKNNDYGFPKKIVLDKLKKIEAKIYRTDQDGTIIMKSDGNNITVETKQTDTNQE